MDWLMENLEAVLTIVTCLAGLVIAILKKGGWIQKKRADELTEAIEYCESAIAAGFKDLDLKTATPGDLAKAARRAVKGTVKQRMKTALKSVAAAVADGAAKVDPDPTKQPRRPLQRLGGLLRARFFGG